MKQNDVFYYELAAKLLDVDIDAPPPEGEDADDIEEHINDLLYERFDVGLDEFATIVDALIPFTNPWVSPLTQTAYQGFVDPREGVVLIKEEYEVPDGVQTGN